MQHRLFRAFFRGFLFRAGHEEDGVVHAERDKEDESVQRHGGICIRETEDMVKDQCAYTHCGSEADYSCKQQQHRKHECMQQDNEHDEHHCSDQWHDDSQISFSSEVRVQGCGRFHTHEDFAVKGSELIDKVCN